MAESDSDKGVAFQNVCGNCHGLILVMDRWEINRIATEAILEVLGFRAALANDAEHATAIYRQKTAEGLSFDAALLDISPWGERSEGLRALELLMDISGGSLKAIASCSVYDGYSPEELMALGFRGVILKPCSINSIESTLKKVTNYYGGKGDIMGVSRNYPSLGPWSMGARRSRPSPHNS